MKTNTKTILLFIMSFALIGLISFTYAYFSNDIVNNNVKDQVVETGTLSLRYVDGPEINMQNIKPGSTITKTIYVANTGTLDAKYNLVWQELNNTITNDEMVIEAKCTRMNGQTEEVDGTCEGLTETPIKKVRIKENISIEPSIVHKYDITITFKEMNKDQNYNQNKKFTGVLGVKEYKAPEVINCTFDGELVQGAEYVNGQYTYRYMQEGTRYSNGLAWSNITSDGWGVQLTNKTSTEPVTGQVCSYINDKPVVSMSYMFENSKATSIDVDTFDTSNVTNMFAMFLGSQATTLDLNSFDTSKVTSMLNMFNGCHSTIIDVSNFDTSNVTDMFGMFSDSETTIIDVSNFNTSNVTDMGYIFLNSKATTLDVSNFDTSNVTGMRGMFLGSKAVTLDLSNFNTSKVINMNEMFANSEVTTIDVSNFDTSNVIYMSGMFGESKATTINGLLKFNTSNVTGMDYMFNRCKVDYLDLSSFDTSNVTKMTYMFNECSNLKAIYVSNKFNVDKVTKSSNMFTDSMKLVGGAGTVYDSSKTDKTYARVDGGTSSPGYFTLVN